MVIEDEIVMGVKATPKRLECGFDVAGDKRLKQAMMRHRLDVNQNMTASRLTWYAMAAKREDPTRS